MGWHAQEARARREELRRACAQRRQRLVSDTARVESRAKELVSWKTYAREYPLGMLAVAGALGLWLGSGPRVGSLLSFAVRQSAGLGLSAIAGRAWQELVSLWEDALANKP